MPWCEPQRASARPIPWRHREASYVRKIAIIRSASLTINVVPVYFSGREIPIQSQKWPVSLLGLPFSREGPKPQNHFFVAETKAKLTPLPSSFVARSVSATANWGGGGVWWSGEVSHPPAARTRGSNPNPNHASIPTKGYLSFGCK